MTLESVKTQSNIKERIEESQAHSFQGVQPSIFVVIPTYNESSNLPNIAGELFALPLPNLSIVVVDDNSPDGTGQVAEDLKHSYPGHMHVVHRPGKQGLGPAYLQGFHYALEHGADYVIQMDADFSHSPSVLTQFFQFTKEYDLIVGSRYVPGSKLDPRWSLMRYWLSYLANSVYVRFILGLHLRDATGGFKCWSRRALSAVLRYPISSAGYIFQVEMNYIAEKLGLCILEIPIYFEDRRLGTSKMSNRVKLEAAWRTWWIRWQYRDLRPLQ